MSSVFCKEALENLNYNLFKCLLCVVEVNYSRLRNFTNKIFIQKKLAYSMAGEKFLCEFFFLLSKIF